MWTAPAPILLSREQTRLGLSAHALSHAARGPGSRLVRLVPGAYARRGDVERLSRAERHRLLVVAGRLTGLLDGEAVLARESAAVVHGLPLVGALPSRIERAQRGRDGGRRTSCCRTLRAYEGWQTTENDGLSIASVGQTLVDLGRRRSLASNLASLDHALRNGLVSREEVKDLASRRPGARGNPALLFALERADPRAESPGESLSRAVMIENHLPEPGLQTEVHDHRGHLVGRVDFMWPQHGVIGEFDGYVKYAREMTGRPVEDVILAERRREIEIENVTGMRVVRWTWRDAYRVDGMLNALAEAGIRPLH
ncbi:hypothetical protein H6X68_05190 [Actinomyces sp. 186855]|nr:MULTISPECIES: hypothetical protein [unclassified Actinomyces]MCL3777686.1 hypothetical protein [Actinomyces sp. AC-20-1]MCL3789790.1 hypothetical protein [Actinomyces sp. 187325]MCL3791984.1 hypothetical protein [Actinomyces sp. 186855]MCL3794647.1 hypothetical protein [Actinomyces sp. 217892]